MARTGIGVATVALAVILWNHPHAQGHPDFSGSWTAADPMERVDPGSSGLALGLSFTVKQDDTSIRIGLPTTLGSHLPGAVALRYAQGQTYQLDGETRVNYPQMASPSATAPQSRQPIATVSRTAWQGDALVVVTHTTVAEHWPDRRPTDFTLESTQRLFFRLDDRGQLVVQGLSVEDPRPWGSLIDRPAPGGPVTTVYKKTS